MRIAVNKADEIYLFDKNDVLTPAIDIDESILPDDFFFGVCTRLLCL